LPNHKSCAKRMKTSEKERIRNRAFRTTLRVAIKELRSETNKEEATKKYWTRPPLTISSTGKTLIVTSLVWLIL